MGLRIAKKFQDAKKTFEHLLLDKQVISAADLENAKLKAATRHLSLARVLMIENLVSETDVIEALAEEHRLEIVDLKEATPSEAALSAMTDKIARKFNVLPLSLENGKLSVCIGDAADIVELNKLVGILKHPFEFKLALPTQIAKALDSAYPSSAHSAADHGAAGSTQETHEKSQGSSLLRVEIQDTGKVSIEEVIKQLLDGAVSFRASDVHVEPEEKIVRVRARIDGVLHEISTFSIDLHPQLLSRLKVVSGLDIAEKRNAQDGSFQHQSETKTIDCRLSTLPTVRGEKAVIRILDKSVLQVKLENLGMPKTMLQNLEHALDAPHGILLVTGPTGSGKTTTVYSMLNHINSIEKNVITVEDPVEFQFPLINQVQVNSRAGLTFAGVLRNILRQDPDIIMLGEIRDKETADLAIRAALTGHLVISTIHTNDSVNTVTRLIDMGIEPFMVSSSLAGVISQRLVRTLCPDCKKPRQMAASELRAFLPPNKVTGDVTVYEPGGCSKCYGYGYRGRQPIFELLTPTVQLRRAISENKSPDELAAILANMGFESMRIDGIQRVLAGKTSLEEVLKATV
ncbi:MAG: Flp pilus assembly complex ATPase component TadA [Bdellovibrionaceae bacterium]|nr:Flp pilus assembly complex ATPase component TadA [Pseudobdellovibrionaceae bacterium]